MKATTPERWLIPTLLLLWLAHLLAYVWLVPPWQHYDEPTHFEYAALIRELGRLPSLDEYIPSLRRSIAASMIDTGFFANSGTQIAQFDLDDPQLSLGINERGHPPLYYTLTALATLPFRHTPILTQLYAARCVGMVLAMLLFAAAYWVLRLLTEEDWQTRCLTLAALVLQPAFTDNISSVNSDALANTVAVLVLLVSLGFLRRPNWKWALVSLLVIILAWNVKRTLLVYSLLIPAAYMFSLPKALKRGVVVFGGGLSAAAILWLTIQPWSIADWRGEYGARHISANAISRDGRAAFVLETTSDTPNPELIQEVYPFLVRELAGKRLTLQAWARADQPTLVTNGPALIIDSQVFSTTVALGPEWELVTLTANVPPQARQVVVRLSGSSVPGTIVYDSLGLTVGDAPIQVAPGEPDGSFERGLLGPNMPRNLVRNASAERRVPALPGVIRQASARLFDEASLSQTMSTLFHPQWIAVVYPRQAWLLFIGTWGVFGWGQYTISPGWFTPLALLVLASILGSVVLMWREHLPGRANEPVWRTRMWWLCAFAVVLGWGTALLRVHNQPFPGAMFWSFGRYTFVAMVPSLLFFIVGVRALLPQPLRAQGTAAVLGFLTVLALVALASFVL